MTSNGHDDAMPLLGVHHIELWTGNAKLASRFFSSIGFMPVGYAGLETGERSVTTHCLRFGEMLLVIKGALTPDSTLSTYVGLHGDSVRSIGLAVEDAVAAFEGAVAAGAAPADAPERFADDGGAMTTASVVACGQVRHTFVQVEGTPSIVMPGVPALDVPPASRGARASVDHVAIAVGLGDLEHQIAFYRDALGFRELDLDALKSVTTDYSALMSRVVAGGEGKVKFPIIEPSKGPRASQVEEFLDFHQGPGVQHIGIATDDIVATADRMRANGVEFLEIEAGYYDAVGDIVPQVAGQIDGLCRNGILVDKDEDGYLLQAFSKPLQDRPTLFLELIERHGSRGFGGGNVRNLFMALEREQAARGNL